MAVLGVVQDTPTVPRSKGPTPAARLVKIDVEALRNKKV